MNEGRILYCYGNGENGCCVFPGPVWGGGDFRWLGTMRHPENEVTDAKADFICRAKMEFFSKQL